MHDVRQVHESMLSLPDGLGNMAAGLKRVLARVPSAVFAPSEHGHPNYRAIDRGLCIGVKFLEYSLAGLVCGFAGQGFANAMMTIK